MGLGTTGVSSMEWGIAQDTMMVELVDTGRGNVVEALLPTLRVTFRNLVRYQFTFLYKCSYHGVSPAQAGQLIAMQR